MKSVLLGIGLSGREADLYLLLLRHSGLTASEIARRSSQSRTHCYDTVSALLKKGLVSYAMKDNVKHFKAAKPERLLEFLDENASQIREKRKEVEQLLPELGKLCEKSAKDDTAIELFEGSEGIKSILNDILREGKSIVTYGSSIKIKDYVPEFFINKYLKERERRNIRARQLFTDLYGVLESPVSDNRRLPNEFASPTTTSVYGNKVIIFIWAEYPKVIRIENKELANAFRKYFELIWKFGKK